MRCYFESNEATSTAKVLGIAYVAHSSYFITIGTDTLHYVLRYILMVFYAVVLYCMVRSCIRNISTIRIFERFVIASNLEDFLPALKLKKRIIWRHFAIAVLYCASLIIALGIHDHVR